MANPPPAPQPSGPAGQVSRQQVQLEAIKTYSGPLPDADDLAKYAGLITNGGNRIMAMAEREQSHRHRMEGLVVMTGVTAQVMGTAAATLVALAFILMAFWLFREGKNGAAFVSMLAPLAGLCGVIVWRVRKKTDE